MTNNNNNYHSEMQINNEIPMKILSSVNDIVNTSEHVNDSHDGTVGNNSNLNHFDILTQINQLLKNANLDGSSSGSGVSSSAASPLLGGLGNIGLMQSKSNSQNPNVPQELTSLIEQVVNNRSKIPGVLNSIESSASGFIENTSKSVPTQRYVIHALIYIIVTTIWILLMHFYPNYKSTIISIFLHIHALHLGVGFLVDRHDPSSAAKIK